MWPTLCALGPMPSQSDARAANSLKLVASQSTVVQVADSPGNVRDLTNPVSACGSGLC